MNPVRLLIVSAPGLLFDDIMGTRLGDRTPLLQRRRRPGICRPLQRAVAADMTQQVWSIATGKAPHDHSVGGAFASMPGQRGLHPIGRRTSKFRPFWELASRQHVETAVVAWPGTQDTDVGAAPLLVVTDDIHVPLGSDRDRWPLLPGIVSDSTFDDHCAEARIHPTQIDTGAVAPFCSGDPTPELVAVMRTALAGCRTVVNVAEALLNSGRFSLMVVHLDFLDRMRRIRGRFPRISASFLQLCYQFVDDQLQRLCQLVRPDSSIMVIGAPARREPKHDAPGAFLLLHEAANFALDQCPCDIFDIAPTALHALGAPIPSRWPGRPMIENWLRTETAKYQDLDVLSPNPDAEWIAEQVQLAPAGSTPLLLPFRSQLGAHG